MSGILRCTVSDTPLWPFLRLSILRPDVGSIVQARRASPFCKRSRMHTRTLRKWTDAPILVVIGLPLQEGRKEPGHRLHLKRPNHPTWGQSAWGVSLIEPRPDTIGEDSKR